MKERTKILITIDWFLPGTRSGGPVRSYANMIEHLGKYHDFLIITRDTDYCSDEVYDSIQSDAWNRINNYLSIYYFSKANLTKSNLTSLIKSTNFDVLYVNGIYSYFFSILPVLLVSKKHKIIVSARGMLNTQAFSVKKFKKTTFISIANFINFYKNVEFHATNEDESAQIGFHIKNFKRMHVAPNLPRKTKDVTVPKHKQTGPTRFVNIARVSVEKGTLKMIDSLKNITSEIILDIFGPIYDSEYWKRCQKQIDCLPENVKVQYKGSLPSEDVPNALRNYDFFILLSEGENFGHAILEAFSAGCPVIISDQTPWKKLQERKIGWDLDLKNIKKVSETITGAASLPKEQYFIMSKAAIDFADNFIENPEVLKQNLQLFQ
ncbi:glycosyltransferase [Arenibacter aquaticus]|uniref:Glycosyltransferase n=1 Tax=Arenibacter aquaticus TaxID=2489054 RepID=A0A3S0CK83_9FLAO|nr:glycosyltransferase [Arenibacter aquaticus]RTE51716.1 glycosyltransferase [Arenibacter aquaticus]